MATTTCPSKFSVHDKGILHSHNTFHPGREKHLKTFNLTLYSPSSVDSPTMLAAKSNSETDPEIKDANQHQNTLGPRRTAKSFDEVHGCACAYAQCVHVCAERDPHLAISLWMDFKSFPAHGSKLRFSAAERQRRAQEHIMSPPKPLFSH